jgi:pectate lyase
MKKTLMILVVGTLFTWTARGQVFVDHFAYDPGNLGTVGSSGGWNVSLSQVTVSSGGLDGSVVGLAGSSGNKVTTTTTSNTGTGSYNQFSSGITAGTVYYSFLLRVNSTSGLTSSGQVITGLLRNGSASSYYQDVWLRLNGSNVEVGLTKLRGTVSWYGTPLSVGTVYLIVSKYQFVSGSSNDLVAMWVNPVTGGTDEPTADISFSTGSDGNTSTGIGRIFIYGGVNADLDEMRVGTAWADVTPSSGEPPPTSTNLVITAINVLSGGLNEGDVELRGTGGPANGSYEVETSSDVSIPYTNWIPSGIHQFDSSGNFACTNGVTPGTLQRFFIVRVGGTNNLPPSPPVIVSQPQDRTNSAGTTATFTVGVSGSPPFSYQWFLNSITPLSAGTNATLTLNNVQTGDSGGYSVLVSNSAGSITSSTAQLLVTNVFSAPVIITQPQSHAVTVGNNTSFGVAATGTQPLFYQWYFNTNSPLADATNSTLQLNNVQVSDAGDYSVTVSNSLGTTDSAFATLTVNTNVVLNFNHVGYADYNFNLTGGSGGPTVDVSQLSDMAGWYGTDDNPLPNSNPAVFRIHGTVTLRTNGDTYFGNNKTFIGVGTNAAIIGDFGLYGCSNIIIRNLDIRNPATLSYGEGDGISCKNGANHIWVDHCTIHDTDDGHLDITRGCDFVTVSWCKFYYTAPTGHEDVNLIGGSDSDSSTDSGKLHVTFHHNWYGALCRERMISCRFGRGHVFNNYYNIGASDNYCNRTRLYAEMLVEGNWFENVKNPWELLTTSGTTGKVLAQYNNVGYLDTSYNVQWLNGWYSGQSLVPGTDTLTPSSWNPASLTDPDPSNVPPYAYTLDNASDVPGIVTNNCGAGKGPFAP